MMNGLPVKVTSEGFLKSVIGVTVLVLGESSTRCFEPIVLHSL